MEMPATEQIDKKPKLNRSGIIGSGGVELSSEKPGKKHKKSSGKKRRLLVGLIVVALCLVAAGVAAYFIFSSTLSTKDPTCQLEDMSFEKKLGCAEGPSDKADVYLERLNGRGIITAGDKAKAALPDAYNAERLYPSGRTALTIASIEEVDGNLAVAIKYYKLFVKRDPSHSDIAYYRQHIIYLEGKI